MTEGYGALTELNHEALHAFSIVGYPRAILTFWSQAAIAQGLRGLVDGLVDDAEPSGHVKWKLAIETGSLGGGGAVMAGAYEHQAFLPPTLFDMDLIVEKATARYRSALDQIEMMQTDPEYMRHVALLWRSSKTYSRDNMQVTDIWREIALNLLVTLGNWVCAWRDICQIGEHAQHTFAGHNDHLHPGTEMPAHVNFAMSHFWYAIEFSLKRQAKAVRDLVPTLAPSEARFASNTPEQKARHLATGTALTKSITWLQDRLLVNEVILDLVSFFDTIEQDLPDATVDPYMSMQLDDLACMDELRVTCL